MLLIKYGEGEKILKIINSCDPSITFTLEAGEENGACNVEPGSSSFGVYGCLIDSQNVWLENG